MAVAEGNLQTEPGLQASWHYLTGLRCPTPRIGHRRHRRQCREQALQRRDCGAIDAAIDALGAEVALEGGDDKLGLFVEHAGGLDAVAIAAQRHLGSRDARLGGAEAEPIVAADRRRGRYPVADAG